MCVIHTRRLSPIVHTQQQCVLVCRARTTQQHILCVCFAHMCHVGLHVLAEVSPIPEREGKEEFSEDQVAEFLASAQ